MSSHTPIEDQILSATREEPPVDFDFNSLAMNVFRHQFQHNSPYRKYCQSLGKSPNEIFHWHDIPALPTGVFKLHDLPLLSFPQEKTRHTFTTSGTTSEVRGHHHFPSLELYEHSIVGAWKQLELPRPTRAVFLTPAPEQAPQSSLSHMMATLSATFADESSWAIDASGKLDVDTVLKATEQDTPLALLGTALAFLHLFEQLDHPIKLPAESWALETGGYKGTQRQLEKAELYGMFHEQLGLEPESIINEYSMTELSSQFYTRGIGRPHLGPSWTRTRVINPLTEKDALPGESGHLVVYDLANLYSVMAIRTQDLAISTGANSFILIGRDPTAIPRGCSRAADDTLRS